MCGKRRKSYCNKFEGKLVVIFGNSELFSCSLCWMLGSSFEEYQFLSVAAEAVGTLPL